MDKENYVADEAQGLDSAEEQTADETVVDASEGALEAAAVNEAESVDIIKDTEIFEDDASKGVQDERSNVRERPVAKLSEDELDSIADATIEALRSILVYFGAEDAEIDEYEGEEGELILDVVGDNLALLIGRHGKTLEALQFLVSGMVNKKTGLRYPVVIDIEGYKQRRKQKIVSQAKASAARAIRQNNDISLRPMNPYERRIVHVALKGDARITTLSKGEEPNRYVVISPN